MHYVSLYLFTIYQLCSFVSGQLNHLNIPLRNNFTLVHTGAARTCSCRSLIDLLLWRVPGIKVINNIHVLMSLLEETEPWTLFMSHLHCGTEDENLSKTVNQSIACFLSSVCNLQLVVLFYFSVIFQTQNSSSSHWLLEKLHLFD